MEDHLMTYNKMCREAWESPSPRYKGIKIEMIDYFDARGMKRVYGRGDCFGRNRYFHMDIWATSSGRLLMRCWSRCSEIDGRSFEIFGIDIEKSIFQPHKKMCDDWIPYIVREAYETWIEEEW
jgi:hypothetical protein